MPSPSTASCAGLHIFLRGEVAVEGARRDVRFGGDVFDGDGTEPVGGEQTERDALELGEPSSRFAWPVTGWPANSAPVDGSRPRPTLPRGTI